MCLAALDIFLRNSICALRARGRAQPDKPKFEINTIPYKGETTMNNNHLQGKTAIITGAGYATLWKKPFGFQFQL